MEGNLTFGPAFNFDLLTQVFQLQEQIEALGQETDEGLDKICFAPMLYPNEEPVLSKCTVQSVFGYFGNSWIEFNRTGTTSQGFINNYLDKMVTCTQYVLTLNIVLIKQKSNNFFF